MRIHLTPRELQVLGEFAKACTYDEIAKTLGIHPHTVRSHQRWLFIKFGVTNRTSLVINAHRQRIINLDD